MPVTAADVLALLTTFQETRDAAKDAHTATTSANQNVISAQASAVAAQSAEDDANVAEDEAFEALVLSLTSFKNEQ